MPAPFQCSADAYQRMQARLHQLETVDRPAASELVSSSRSDSLSAEENHGYMQALQDFEQLENQIADLKHLLSTAVIVEPGAAGQVTVGSTVVLDMGGDEWSVLVGEIVEDAGDADLVSPGSPLGLALLGAAAGDTVTWAAPAGSLSATVVTIS